MLHQGSHLRSVCLLRLSAIGDVTHVLPVIHALQTRWPALQITWVIGKLEAQLVDGLAGVEFITFDKSAGLSAYWQLKRALKGRRFDVLLHMQAALRASIASLMIKADQRIGFDRARAIDGQWLFTNTKIPARAQQHVLDGFMAFARMLDAKPEAYHWPLPLGAAASYPSTLPLDQPLLIAVNLSTSVRRNNFREWPLDRFSQLIRHVLNEYPCQVVLTGGPSSKELAAAASVEQSLNDARLINVVGKTQLKELAALLAKADVMISPDTGPAHIANAMGTPVIGLYATSNPERTGPYDRRYTVSKYREALAQEGLDIASVKWGRRVRNEHAMSLIELDDVKAVLAHLVREISAYA